MVYGYDVRSAWRGGAREATVRNVRVALKPKAERILEKLSVMHSRELTAIVPGLIEALSAFVPAK